MVWTNGISNMHTMTKAAHVYFSWHSCLSESRPGEIFCSKQILGVCFKVFCDCCSPTLPKIIFVLPPVICHRKRSRPLRSYCWIKVVNLINSIIEFFEKCLIVLSVTARDACNVCLSLCRIKLFLQMKA